MTAGRRTKSAFATPLLLAAALVALAALVSWREHGSQLERLATAQAARVGDAIDDLQKDLTKLENMARYAVALYDPADPHDPDALVDFSGRLLPLVPQAFSMVWAPAVAADDMPGMLSRLGRREPVAPTPGQPVMELGPGEPRFLNFDIHPRTELNLLSRGLVLNSLALPGRAIADAVALKTVRATAPIRLVQLPDKPALVIYGPILGRDGRTLGVLGFSYRFDALFEAANQQGLAVRAWDRQAQASGDVFANGQVEPGRAIVRDVTFAGRTYGVEASLGEDPAALALRSALLTFLLGLCGAIAVGAVAYRLALSNQALEASLAAREKAEEQLRVVLSELNHRIGNLLTLVQGVARQTFAADRDVKESTALFEGRLSALAHSGRMATGVAQGVTLADMARDILDGFGDRFTIDGPDLPLGPQGGQFLALAIHELATNAAKHGALANLEGRVSLSWRAEGGSFTLDWRESGGPERPPAPAAEGKGFGSRLLGHLVPAQLGGAAKREMTPEGLRWKLEAPLERLGR